MSDVFQDGADQWLGQADGWLQVLRRLGSEAAEWAQTYVDVGAPEVTRRIHRAVGLMHRNDVEAARRLLATSSGETAPELRQAPASVQRIVDVRHAAAAAYDHYGTRHWDGVEAMFQRSVDAVGEAIDAHRFLAILGTRFIDVELQRAQVARARYRWDTMEERIDIGWQKLEGRHPLRSTHEGATLWFRDIEELIGSATSETEDMSDDLRFLHPRWVRARFRSLVAEAYALPWMLIPHG